MAAVGKGAPPPSPESLNKLLRPLGIVSQTGVLEWSSSFKVHLARAEVTIQDRLYTPVKCSARSAAKPVAFVAASLAKAPPSDALRRDEAPVVAQQARYFVKAVRHFATINKRNTVTVLSKLVRACPDALHHCEGGAFLPLEECSDTHKPTYTAIHASTPCMGIYHSRYQILVFDAKEGRDAAERYVERCWHHGLGDWVPITEVKLPMAKRVLTKVIAKAFYLPSRYMMLKLMRSCIDVKEVSHISELWFNKNE